MNKKAIAILLTAIAAILVGVVGFIRYNCTEE